MRLLVYRVSPNPMLRYIKEMSDYVEIITEGNDQKLMDLVWRDGNILLECILANDVNYISISY